MISSLLSFMRPGDQSYRMYRDIPKVLRKVLMRVLQNPSILVHDGCERYGPYERDKVHVQKLQLRGHKVEIDVLRKRPHLEIHDLSIQICCLANKRIRSQWQTNM